MRIVLDSSKDVLITTRFLRQIRMAPSEIARERVSWWVIAHCMLRVLDTDDSVGVLDFQKLPHLLQCLVQRPLKGTAAWPRAGEAQLVLQLAIGYLQIGPAQHLLAP